MIKSKSMFKLNNIKEKGNHVDDSFEYNSGNNKDILSIEKIRQIIKKIK